MKTKAKAIEECTTLFEIEVTNATIEKAFEEVYDEITKIANIPGFRPGKAPRELVKKHYAKDAKEEVLKRLIPEAYRSAVDEHKISPIGLPDISEVKFEGEGKLAFKAKVNTRPKFKLKDYKGMKIEKKKAEVRDEDVDKTIASLREVNARYITVDDRALQMGDYVVSDLECSVDGTPAHKKREGLWIYVDKESIVPELAANIVGMKKGEERDIEVKMPDNYPDKKMAGKSATYHILAKEIKSRQLPEINDEFAKDLGKDNLGELKKEVFKELEMRAKYNAEIDMENQLLNKLMDEHDFSVPPTFVVRQLDFMVDDAKRRLQEKGFKKEELDKKDSEFKEKFKSDAVRQVRLLFILDEIAKLENIEVNQEDVDKAYKSIAVQTGKGEDAVKDYYVKEDLVDDLKEKLREGKVIKFLLENAQVVEKDK